VRLDDAELAQRFVDRVEPAMFRRARTDPQPVTVLLGGQPGAGKTAGVALVRAQYPGRRLVAVVGDDLRRFHPSYDALATDDPLRMPEVTAAASGRWIQMCIDHANKAGHSVVIEGTWRSENVVITGAELAKHHGRQTHAVVLGVPADVTRLSTLGRYYDALLNDRKARWTPPGAHDQVVEALPRTVERVAGSQAVDRFTVVDREGEVLFDQTAWSEDRAGRGREAFEAGFRRPLTAEERSRAAQDVARFIDAHARFTAGEPAAEQVIEWARTYARVLAREDAASISFPATPTGPTRPQPGSTRPRPPAGAPTAGRPGPGPEK
jgi:UDP-N-acetylglucosamine kinase